MINNLIKNLHWIEYCLGLVVYFIFIFNEQFSLGIIWLIFILYSWTITSLIIKQYSLQTFIYALSFLGIIVSLTIFFMNGVEEVPFPKGAIKFKLEGITQSLIIFFIFTLPLIVFNQKPDNKTEVSAINVESFSPTPASPTSDNQTEDEWEEATQEDLESGRFEPV